MKKVLVCALAALFLMASCVTAFANPIAYTTTTYNDDGTVTVSTSVGAEANEMVTYLAYVERADDNNDTIDDAEIKYIDQQTATGATVVFKHTFASKADYSGSTIQSGSNKAETARDIATGHRKVYIQLNNDTENKTLVELDTNVNASKVYTTTATITNGHKIDKASFNDGSNVITDNVKAENNVIKLTDATGLEDGDIIIVETSAVDNHNPAVSNEKYKAFTTKEGENDIEILTVYAIADTDITTDFTTENAAGIVISKDKDKIDTDTITVNGTDVIEYQAYGMGANGEYAIQLKNETGENELTTQNWYAKAYSQDANKDRVYGALLTFEAVANE